MENPRGRPRSSRRRLDADRDQILKEYVEDKVSVRKMAAKIGVCELTFRRWLKDNGITPRGVLEEGDVRRQRFLDARNETDAKIVRLRVKQGVEIQEIHDRLDVSITRICATLHDSDMVRIAQNADSPEPKPPKGQEKLDALKPDVLAAIEEGLSSNQLAIRFGVSQSSVLRWIKDKNVQFSNLTAIQKKIIALWNASDLNVKAVAEKLQCGRTTVTTTLRKVGLIDRRTALGRPPGSAKEKRSIIHRPRQVGQEDLSGGPSP